MIGILPNGSRGKVMLGGGLLFLCWLIFWLATADPLAVLVDFWHFFLLGLLGATVANSTGAGGGVVFIPAFSSLGLTAQQTLATSILIQCFGMTAGSIAWLRASSASRTGSVAGETLQKKLLQVTGLPAIGGVLCGQYLLRDPSLPMLEIFRWFSIFFGSALLTMSLLKLGHVHVHVHGYLRRRDIPLLVVTSFLGGVMTAWISIAIGEFIALLLILRHYPTMVAVCTGVCLSSISVLCAATYHLWVVPNVVWEVLLFAAPAALCGGSYARWLAVRMGPGRLKIFFATWILVTGLAM